MQAYNDKHNRALKKDEDVVVCIIKIYIYDRNSLGPFKMFQMLSQSS